jgi:hypothetical protein
MRGTRLWEAPARVAGIPHESGALPDRGWKEFLARTVENDPWVEIPTRHDRGEPRDRSMKPSGDAGLPPAEGARAFAAGRANARGPRALASSPRPRPASTAAARLADRLACLKGTIGVCTGVSEEGSPVARAAGQLSSRPSGAGKTVREQPPTMIQCGI